VKNPDCYEKVYVRGGCCVMHTHAVLERGFGDIRQKFKNTKYGLAAICHVCRKVFIRKGG